MRNNQYINQNNIKENQHQQRIDPLYKHVQNTGAFRQKQKKEIGLGVSTLGPSYKDGS
jgi:hypothetical protein